MIECSNCGKDFYDDFEFCPYCGAKAPEPKLCPKCEFKDFEYEYCPKCGIKLLTKEEINKERNKTNQNNTKNSIAEEYYQKALQYQKENKNDLARTKCLDALRFDPNNTKYKNKLQEIKNKLQELQEIKNKAEPYYQETLTEEKQGNYKLAIAHINKAIELDPNNIKYKIKLTELQDINTKHRKINSTPVKKTLRPKTDENFIENIIKENRYVTIVKEDTENIIYGDDDFEKEEYMSDYVKARKYYKKAVSLENSGIYSEAKYYLEKAVQLDSYDYTYKEKLRLIEEKLKKSSNNHYSEDHKYWKDQYH